MEDKEVEKNYKTHKLWPATSTAPEITQPNWEEAQ